MYFKLHIRAVVLILFFLEREMKHLCPLMKRYDDFVLIFSPEVSFTNEEIKMTTYTHSGLLHVGLKSELLQVFVKSHNPFIVLQSPKKAKRYSCKIWNLQ